MDVKDKRQSEWQPTLKQRVGYELLTWTPLINAMMYPTGDFFKQTPFRMITSLTGHLSKVVLTNVVLPFYLALSIATNIWNPVRQYEYLNREDTPRNLPTGFEWHNRFYHENHLEDKPKLS
ncbi:MAG TPA: hypothetical protein VJK51_02375 [Candidatus Nanoarchaeia archaeon]|nr:hypothetical protein [Candidatus Nanoarchaeia archaeon]